MLAATPALLALFTGGLAVLLHRILRAGDALEAIRAEALILGETHRAAHESRAVRVSVGDPSPRLGRTRS